ncbi:MAG: tRNA (N(6)-L-threonylcarbamoyladenosine(37)-C(2))-methylthiotransferase MtaB [Armatimonadota bacterium]
MPETRRPRASLYTLGCKVNQYETRETAAELLRMGYRIVPFGQPADVCVVNTCSVTDQADVKSRAAIRRARRAGDDPLVVATGCYADAAPDEVAALPGVEAVVANRDKPRLAEVVDDVLRRSGRLLFSLAEEGAPAAESPEGLVQLMAAAEGTLARTRAVIKIQDGCNHFCSFCIIPFTRGRLRSRPPAEVLAEARELARMGYRELVLTGICLGDFGDERGFEPGAARGDRDPLALLLEELAAIPGVERLRMSSIDPADTSDDLLRTMARLPQVCRHLHLSLQAGDEEVLRRMRRRYSAADFRALVDRIYTWMPDAGLTCDVIVGFPGETDAQFEETARLCEYARFCKIHAFPYSVRSGTLAARLEDDVPAAEKQRRVHALMSLSDRLGLEFAERYAGETVEVLVEQRDRHSGQLSGLTGNYLRVSFDGDDSLRGSVVPVRVRSVGSEGAAGVLAAEEPVLAGGAE